MSTAPPAPAPTLDLIARPMLIRRAAVLGAGTMGSRIAALLANVGIPVLLLDMPFVKSRSAPTATAPAIASPSPPLKPSPNPNPPHSSIPQTPPASLPGNFEDDLPQLAQCDWVIEAVAENLAIKHALLERVAPHLGPNTPAHHQHLRPAHRPDRLGTS